MKIKKIPKHNIPEGYKIIWGNPSPYTPPTFLENNLITEDMKYKKGNKWIDIPSDLTGKPLSILKDHVIAERYLFNITPPLKTPENSKEPDASEEIDDIANACNEALKYGLEMEVIWSALRAMKECPHYTIGQAMEAGLYEWDI